jgi:hypothetical protein
MIIPSFLLIVGVRQFYSGYNFFVKGKEYEDSVDLSEPWPWIWKWLTRIALLISVYIAFWAVFFIFVFFMVFPYLFMHAMGEQFEKMKQELVKLQPAETPSGAEIGRASCRERV